ncbi:hypothetical protein [Lachnoclostridium phytofermentans]|uniref:hypothetical protein n=1 Tax=Lachnoclostridium phytofermentans TaxID=66219 RepID=UPI0004963134|nr:hypothetical protein [Lachnoclostridium phytofermentans]
MKNQKKLFILSIASYLLFSLSCFLTICLSSSIPYLLIGALSCLFIAALFHLLGKKGRHNNFYFVSIVLTNLISGVSVGCYLYLEEHKLSLLEFLISLGIFLLLCTVLLVLHMKVVAKRNAMILSCGALLVAFIPCIYLWVSNGIYLYAFLSFSLIMNFFYNLSYVLQHKENSTLLRDFSFGSFGAFFIVTYLVLVLITDGDALELLDSVDVSTNSKNKNTISM